MPKWQKFRNGGVFPLLTMVTPTDSAHIAGFVGGLGLIFLFRDPALVAAKRSLSE